MNDSMISLSRALAGVLVFLPCGLTRAQEKPVPPPAAPAKPEPAAAETVAEDLEVAFAALLRNAVFQGRWCMVENGKMGPDKEEKYSIISVVKSGGDRWMVNTRIEYGDKNYVFPVPVQVRWAGDTPILVVDKLTAPGGVYSARVMIFEKTYSGTWTAGDHGGLLHGVIVADKEAAGQ